MADRDTIYRFSFVNGPVRGQWVRLESVLDALYEQRHYPVNVADLLGEMLAAVALVADGIKFNGAVTLQSRGPGPLTTVLAECRRRHLLRGIARWSDQTPLPDTRSLSELLGDGQLALSLIPEDTGQPYQGLVALTDNQLARNLERYFQDSEQLPTRLMFAGNGSAVTGLLLQRLPDADHATEIELDENDAFWEEIGLLTATLSEQELAELEPRQLLNRLYGARPLNLHQPRSLQFSCTCSRDKSSATLKALGREAIFELLEERGEIEVTCEICGACRRFDPIDTHALFEPDAPRLH